jgi:hypothetical protein
VLTESEQRLRAFGPGLHRLESRKTRGEMVTGNVAIAKLTFSAPELAQRRAAFQARQGAFHECEHFASCRGGSLRVMPRQGNVALGQMWPGFQEGSNRPAPGELEGSLQDRLGLIG